MPAMTKKEAIENIVNRIDEIKKNSDYEYIGVRVQESEFVEGEILEPSFVWEDGEMTDEELDGTCAVKIEDVRLANNYFGDHVAIIGLTVAVFELTAGDAARERVVALACAGVVAAAYDCGNSACAGQITVGQAAVIADKEADHTARDCDAVTPSSNTLIFPAVRKRSDCDTISEVDMSVRYRTRCQDSCKRTRNCGVLPRTRVAIRPRPRRRFGVCMTCLLSADKVVLDVDPDIIDRALVDADQHTGDEHAVEPCASV